MKTKILGMVTLCAAAAVLSLSAGKVWAGCGSCAADKKAAYQAGSQTKCPIMGGAVDKKQFVDAHGCRIYVCCAGCVAKVKADPAAAIAKIKANGETPAKAAASSAK